MTKDEQKEFAELISKGISTQSAQNLRDTILASEPLYFKDLIFKLVIANDILFEEILKLRGENEIKLKPVKTSAKCAKKH